MKKSATVYLFKNKIIVHSESETTAGVWILSDPVISIEDIQNKIKTGEAVQKALLATKIGVPHPTIWKGAFDPVLKLAGVKSYNTFAKEALCVIIIESDSILEFLPTKNLGAKEGFEPLREKKIIQTVSTIEELGENTLKALDLCS